jgi:hypothetical protein
MDRSLVTKLSRRFAREEDFTYVVRGGDCVKIGRSARPKQRIAGIQKTSPIPVETLAVVPKRICDEEEAHQLFHEARLHGEWFTYTPELQAFVVSLQAHERAEAMKRLIVERLKAQFDGPTRRPLAKLARAEVDLRQRVITERKAFVEQLDQEHGCGFCGETYNLRRSPHMDGFFCGTCKTWLSSVSNSSLREMRTKAAEALERARRKLVEHDYRAAKLAQLLGTRQAYLLSVSHGDPSTPAPAHGPGEA